VTVGRAFYWARTYLTPLLAALRAISPRHRSEVTSEACVYFSLRARICDAGRAREVEVGPKNRPRKHLQEHNELGKFRSFHRIGEKRGGAWWIPMKLGPKSISLPFASP
jgi:hypothetical protein